MEKNSYSIMDIIKAFFRRIKIVIACIAVCILVTILILSLTPPKYNLLYTITVNDLDQDRLLESYRLKRLSIKDLYYLANTETALNNAYYSVTGEKKPDTFYFSIDYDDNARFINFSKENTTDPELYQKVINTLINNIVDSNKSSYEEYSHVIEDLEAKKQANLDKLANLSINSGALVYLTTSTLELEKDILSLERCQQEINDNIKTVNEFIITEVPQSKIPALISSTLIGSFIGLIITIVLMVRDHNIYTSEDLLEVIDKKDLIGLIPFYKHPAESISSEIHFNYILSRLSNSNSSIVITSISPKAGKTYISDGFKTKYPEYLIIEDQKPLKEESLFLSDNNKESMILVIVKAGTDTKEEVSLIYNDMKQRDVNIKFILNAADANDPMLFNSSNNANIYKISKLKPFSSFYKKHQL